MRRNKTINLKNSGVGRNRTDDEAFAEPCLTTWLPRRNLKITLEMIIKHNASFFFKNFTFLRQ